MLHEIGVELRAKLAAAGCPFPVVDGPEPTQSTTYARERIVIEHGDNDSFTAVRSQRSNPPMRGMRNVSAKLTIYAQSPAPSAIDWEHRRRAEHVLDLVLVALDEIALVRKNAWNASGGKFVQPDDLKANETRGGAAYELTFTIERGVYAQKWNGDIRQTVSGIPISGTDRITTTNGPSGETPETAC